MSSFGQVPRKHVWEMLEHCAPGHTRTETQHHYCIRWGDKPSYPAFPKGAHGKANPPIEVGHIKRLARFLGILACAKDFLGI